MTPSTSAFSAIAEPTRRRILDRLRAGEATVNGLAEALDLPQPTVSKHLKVLRRAGLVVVRGEGNRRHHRLEPAGLDELLAWLQPFREIWADRLDALSAHLDRTFPEPGPVSEPRPDSDSQDVTP